MILSALIILTISFVVCNYAQCLIKWKKSRLPTIIFFPILGHTPYLSGTTDVFIKKLSGLVQNFQSFGLFTGPFFTPLIFDQKNVTHLISSEDHMQEKSYLYKFLKTLSGGSRTIFASTGTEYRESRKISIAAVSHANLKEYVKSFNENAKNLVENLRAKTGEKEFNLEPELNFCVISSLLETIMGLESSAMTRDEITEFSTEFSKSLEYIMYRMYSTWLHPDFIYKLSNLHKLSEKSNALVRKVARKLILARKTKWENANTIVPDQETKLKTSVFIDKYFISKKENGEDFTIHDISGDVMSLLGAGFETTVSTLGFAFMLLAINQETQAKIHEEIDTKLKGKEEFSAKDLLELSYLDMVICETWRLYPPVTAIGRKMTKDLELPNGGIFDKGTNIIFYISKIHRDPIYYPDPNTFNPENFLPEKVKARPQNCFLPFGFGARRCFGNIFAKLVIKSTMCHLLRKYHFSTTKTERDFRLAFNIALKNKIGVPVSISLRNKV